jgi:hypothetical protein
MLCQFRGLLVSLICLFVTFSSVNFILAANPPTGEPLTEFQKRFKDVVDVYTIFGQTSEQLIVRFGDPSSSVKYPVASPHNPTDKSNEKIIIHYPDASFQLLRVGKHIDPNAEFYQEIILTDGRWKMPHGLHVGLKRDQVNAILGEPVESKQLMDVYTNHFEGYTNPMDANYYKGAQFYYRDKVLKKIRIILAID